jgi:hypothetical protein
MYMQLAIEFVEEMSRSKALPSPIKCKFFKETWDRIVEDDNERECKQDLDKQKFEGYNTSDEAMNTIDKIKASKFYNEYYDTLMRPLSNLVRFNPDHRWADLAIGPYNRDDESQEKGLGYLHHAFKSISQYNQTNSIRYMRSIKTLVSDLHSPYEVVTKQIPSQGSGLPIAIIDNCRKIIFTTTPPLDLLIYSQIGVTFVNIARQYSTWPAYWPLLGHEVCGHEIINGFYNIWIDKNPIVHELSEKVRKFFTGNTPKRRRLVNKRNTYGDRVSIAFDRFVRDYWTDQQIFQETLASIMGYLSMGPSYGIALYSILKPLMKHRWGLDSLLKMCEEDDLPYGLHPIGILHLVIGQRCMQKFSEKHSGGYFDSWANYFRQLANAEQGAELTVISKERPNSEKLVIPRDKMVSSVENIVDIVGFSPLNYLEGQSIADYFRDCWDSCDEQETWCLVKELQLPLLETDNTGNLELLKKKKEIKARHVVAAATIASAEAEHKNDIDLINENAIAILDQMYDQPSKAKPKVTLRAAPIESNIALPESSRRRGFATLRTF